jgi:hypothetical protein
MDQIEDPDINPYINSQPIFDKRAQNTILRKEKDSSQK